MIAIVDYGMGNLGSIANMLKKLGAPARISSDPAEIASAEKLILPGVGAFDAAMERIDEAGFRAVLNERALQARVPMLGICLGMQLLTQSSEEGQRPGLGWIDARTLAFNDRVDEKLRVPHMGWNVVDTAASSPLTAGLDSDDETRFYFVHSYFVQCANDADVILTTDYGRTFHSGLRRDNIYGVQFHPEKSHRYGMKLLGAFAEL